MAKKDKPQVLLRKRAPQVVKDARRERQIRRTYQRGAAIRHLNGVHGLVVKLVREAPEVRELIQAKQPAEPVLHGIPRFYLAGLSDVNFTINGQCEGDERIATRWSIRAVHSGELLGVPPTGRELTIAGVTFSVVEGELVKLEDFKDPAGNPVEEMWAFWVVEEWNYMDLPAFAAMLRNGRGAPA